MIFCAINEGEIQHGQLVTYYAAKFGLKTNMCRSLYCRLRVVFRRRGTSLGTHGGGAAPLISPRGPLAPAARRRRSPQAAPTYVRTCPISFLMVTGQPFTPVPHHEDTLFLSPYGLCIFVSDINFYTF